MTGTTTLRSSEQALMNSVKLYFGISDISLCKKYKMYCYLVNVFTIVNKFLRVVPMIGNLKISLRDYA